MKDLSDAPSLRKSPTPERFRVLLSGRIEDRNRRDIPWGLIAPHERQAEANHYQPLRRLNERGGLSWVEMIAVLEDRPWRKMETADAQAAVERLVAAFEGNRKDGSSPQNNISPTLEKGKE